MRCPACGNILYFDWCDECNASIEDIVAELEEDGDYENEEDFDDGEDDFDELGRQGRY